MDAEFWDERYGSHDRLFSGNPNGVLVAETSELPPGRALDVGCGEGGDAIWLARRGWRVTALDISRVALRRAAVDGANVEGRVEWVRADLSTSPPPSGPFDLVSLQYFPLPRLHGTGPLKTLLASVAPGGTLLVVGHAIPEQPSPQRQPDADPSDYYHPGDFARHLDDGWSVLVDETRPRVTPPPEGSGHTHDVVLRAKRLR